MGSIPRQTSTGLPEVFDENVDVRFLNAPILQPERGVGEPLLPLARSQYASRLCCKFCRRPDIPAIDSGPSPHLVVDYY